MQGLIYVLFSPHSFLGSEADGRLAEAEGSSTSQLVLSTLVAHGATLLGTVERESEELLWRFRVRLSDERIFVSIAWWLFDNLPRRSYWAVHFRGPIYLVSRRRGQTSVQTIAAIAETLAQDLRSKDNIAEVRLFTYDEFNRLR